MKLLLELADQVDLKDAINRYLSGEEINETENRAVLHTALRTPKSQEIIVDGVNVVSEVHQVKEKIKQFSQLMSVEGSPIPIRSHEPLEIKNASVLAADIEASNGIIHVIDTVILMG